MIPELQRLPPGETFHVFDVGEPMGHRRVRRREPGPHVAPLRDRRRPVERVSMPFRYVWPAELDLMARARRDALRERWGGWKREPFTSDSRQHVSVWEKPAEP